MSDALTPEAPLPPASGGRRFDRERSDRDAMIAALVAVLFVHLLVVWLSPREAPIPEPVAMPENRQARIELLPPPLEAEDEPEFVRSNPAAPEEVPENTRNYSNRDQVAAQEEVAPPNPDDLPLVEGDREDSNRVVQGSPYQPPPGSQAVAQQAQEAESPAVPQQPAPDLPIQQTRPDVLEQAPETEEGLLAREDPADSPEELEEDVEIADVANQQRSPLDGRGEAQNTTPRQQQQQQAPQVREPRPDRPTLQDNSYGPLIRTFTGVSRSGKTRIDSRFSEFGVYWNRVLEIIELKWNQLVSNSFRSIQFNGRSVTVEFTLSRDGSVTSVRVVQSGVGRLPETLAIDAIQSPSPFADWTPEMIATMGMEVSKQITFIY